MNKINKYFQLVQKIQAHCDYCSAVCVGCEFAHTKKFHATAAGNLRKTGTRENNAGRRRQQKKPSAALQKLRQLKM